MIFTKFIIKNCLPWVTSYYMPTYNEQPNIIHKVTFWTSLSKTSFWWDTGPSSIFIIISFLLFFSISFPIHAFNHRIKRSFSQSAITDSIIKAIGSK